MTSLKTTLTALSLGPLACLVALVGCSEIYPFETSQMDASSDAALDRSIGDLQQDIMFPADLVPDTAPDITPPDITPPDITPPDMLPTGCYPCPNNCNVGAGRCYRVTASNGQAAVMAGFDKAKSEPAVTLSSPTSINTDTGVIISGSTTIRAGNKENDVSGGVFWQRVPSGKPSISVFVLSKLVVKAGVVVSVEGNLPLAIYATEDVEINGSIVTQKPSSGYQAVAGGYQGGASTGQPGICVTTASEAKAGTTQGCIYGAGGGGGGYYKAGGSGGEGDTSPCKGGAGGIAWGNPSLVPLRGGCGGGAGGQGQGLTSYMGGYGGGGGGAIQITANMITIKGKISMPGQGGGSSTGTSGGKHAGGGGGGSGGAILLEASTILIAGGFLAANGGGAGAGGKTITSPGAPGGDSQAAAPGRASDSVTYWGSGGDGGAAQNSGVGQPALPAPYSGGGGGGAAGRIRCNTPTTPSPCPASCASPAPSTSSTINGW